MCGGGDSEIKRLPHKQESRVQIPGSHVKLGIRAQPYNSRAATVRLEAEVIDSLDGVRPLISEYDKEESEA